MEVRGRRVGSRQHHRDRANPRLKFLDRYGGIPVVVALGAIRWLSGKRTVPECWKTVGLLVTAGIGDAVLASAVIGDLRRSRPDARIVLFVTANNAGFARLLSVPDAIVELPVRRLLHAVKGVRAEGCDVIVDLDSWRRFDAVLAACSGAKVTIGRRTPGQHRHFAYDIVVDHRRDHELENHRRLVAPLGVVSTSRPLLCADETPAIGNPYAVLHLWPGGANCEERSWPTDRWVSLAHELRRRRLAVALTGGPENTSATDRLVAALRDQGIDARSAAGCSWTETLRLLAGAAGVVSVNTGVMHVAAALGAPTIVLDGPTGGRRWGPIGLHVRRVASPMAPDGYLDLGFERDRRYEDCMSAITVDMVSSAWDDLFVEVAKLRSSPSSAVADREP